MYVHTYVYVTGFAKSGLIHTSNFSTLRMCNSASIGPTALKFGSRTSYHCTNRTENFSLIACLQMSSSKLENWMCV